MTFSYLFVLTLSNKRKKVLRKYNGDRVIMTSLQFLHSWNWNMLWDLLSSNDLLPSVQWFISQKHYRTISQDDTQTQFIFFSFVIHGFDLNHSSLKKINNISSIEGRLRTTEKNINKRLKKFKIMCVCVWGGLYYKPTFCAFIETWLYSILNERETPNFF